MEMKFGPRMLVINNQPTKQTTEVNTMKLESYEMPECILSIRNRTEESVAAWYRQHSGKLKTQVKENPELLFFPAPPVLLSSEEEE